MNFERQYLAALDALIVALGGVVPVGATTNFQLAHLMRLVAIVQAVGGVLPLPSMNYQAAVLAHWRAAIAARGGVVPTVYSNFSEALLLHVQAFQATRSISVVLSAPNFEQNILALLSAVSPYDAAAQAWFTAVEVTGATFGPTAEAIATNKAAFSTFFAGCKDDASPNGGVSNFAALEQLIFLRGVSTLTGQLVSAIGPNPTNVGFVSGDHNSATGLRDSDAIAYLDSNRANNLEPQNNASRGVFIATPDTRASNTYRGYFGGGNNNASGSDYCYNNDFNAIQTGIRNDYLVVDNTTIATASGLLGLSRNSSRLIRILCKRSRIPIFQETAAWYVRRKN